MHTCLNKSSQCVAPRKDHKIHNKKKKKRIKREKKIYKIMTVLKTLIELKLKIFFVNKKKIKRNLRIKTRSVFHINIME